MNWRLAITYVAGVVCAFSFGFSTGKLQTQDRLQLCRTVLHESVQAHKKTIGDLRRSLEQLRDELEKQVQDTQQNNAWMQGEIEAMEDARRRVGL